MALVTVFVKSTGHCPKYMEKLQEYFGKEVKIVKCHNNREINGYSKETKWYVVLSEGEYFDRKLMRALLAVLSSGTKHAYMCFKKDKKRMRFHVRPFIFRDFVKLNDDDLNPVSGLLNCDRLLDGWVYDTYNS